jgi:hypothetical protein
MSSGHLGEDGRNAADLRGRPRWRVFRSDARISVHTHHGRKYADAWLPEDRAFRFLGGNGSVISTAHNLIEFCGAVKSVGMDSLRDHLLHGDFSRWAAGVLGDGPRGRSPETRADRPRRRHAEP